jgi:hypothetical protein
MWIEDPDGVRIVLVEVPADHPLRRDPGSRDPKAAAATLALNRAATRASTAPEADNRM